MFRKIQHPGFSVPSGILEPRLLPMNLPAPVSFSTADYPAFLETIGLVGMGGGIFPVSRKIRASCGVHTLVINAVECEPGITIDQALLLYHSRWIIAGAEASARAVGAKRIVLAVKKEPELIKQLCKLYPSFDLLIMKRTYPAGAERLILRKLLRRMPPPGALPFHLGVLVQNAATLRAAGRAILDGIAAVERPLTLVAPDAGCYQNLIAPVGITFSELLESSGCAYDQERQILIAGGLMMGRAVSSDERVTLGTTSVLVLNRSRAETKETDCIRCGACYDVCPLKLHPIALVDIIRKKQPHSEAFKSQMKECFLCGACAAVCPARIPLAVHLREGKKCL
ncbi:MAG: 4Fe-4S dicluster domain-containing protein [Verrucomicrobia bacterium]|nr:4Fe-4S dicluster domain-containing protein [Verrucomicrobiota bacterium]